MAPSEVAKALQASERSAQVSLVGAGLWVVVQHPPGMFATTVQSSVLLHAVLAHGACAYSLYRFNYRMASIMCEASGLQSQMLERRVALLVGAALVLAAPRSRRSPSLWGAATAQKDMSAHGRPKGSQAYCLACKQESSSCSRQWKNGDSGVAWWWPPFSWGAPPGVPKRRIGGAYDGGA